MLIQAAPSRPLFFCINFFHSRRSIDTNQKYSEYLFFFVWVWPLFSLFLTISGFPERTTSHKAALGGLHVFQRGVPASRSSSSIRARHQPTWQGRQQRERKRRWWRVRPAVGWDRRRRSPAPRNVSVESRCQQCGAMWRLFTWSASRCWPPACPFSERTGGILNVCRTLCYW